MDLEQQHESGTLGMWSFLITEIMFFGGLFLAYFVYRQAYPAAFASASNKTDVLIGAFNTTVLICSSLTMALAVHYAAIGKKNLLVLFLILTLLLGGAFLGVKTIEYHDKFVEHYVPGSTFAFDKPFDDNGQQIPVNANEAQLYFSLYFAMTGMHALHMIIGCGLFGVLAVFAWKGRYSPGYFTPIENAGLYWHLVDLIWIYLFPLLYLISRHS